MSYSVTALTDDYYEGTTCLINKFNIQNEEQLAKVEASITLAKTAQKLILTNLWLQRYILQMELLIT